MNREKLRSDALSYASQLANGIASQNEVAAWAQALLSSKETGAIIQDDEELNDVLDTLCLADAIDEVGNPLYGQEDFKDWLAEIELLLSSDLH